MSLLCNIVLPSCRISALYKCADLYLDSFFRPLCIYVCVVSLFNKAESVLTDYGSHKSKRRGVLHCSCFPKCLWQDEYGNADTDYSWMDCEMRW